MKKSNLAVGIVYVLIGIGLLLAALLTDSRLEGLLYGFSGAGIGPGCMMIYKYFYWSAPRNAGRYREKIEAETIELHDELKDKVRCRAAQYVYVFSLGVISLSTVVFAVLSSLEILENGNVFVGYLAALMAFQIISGHLLFRHFLKKYA